MCLVVLAHRMHPRYRLVVAANRDEFHAREAAPLSWWSDRPGLLAGRDLVSGGTWLGATLGGRFATVTNFREFERSVGADAPSRGGLVPAFLADTGAAGDHLQRTVADAGRYAGYSLLADDGSSLWYASNRGQSPVELGAGVYGLANDRLDEPWPKVVAGRQRMERAIASDDSPVGIQPFGAAVDFLASGATNWQIFKELVDYATSEAARIYLGTDGTLGSKGGAPGVDVQSLFGVAATRVEGDLKCIEKGLRTGVIEPWCAVNFGDSTLAPTRRYMLPDADADAARASLATRKAAFYEEIEKARANGFEINQDVVNRIASEHGVTPPVLPVESKKAPSIALAPTDIARVVTVNEARASAGVGPLTLPTGAPDPDGALTVEQFAAKKAAQVAPAAAPSPLRAVP